MSDKLKDLFYMPFFVADHMTEIMGFDHEEIAIYFLLIMYYWINGPIKNDKKTIKNIAKKSFKKCEKILQKFDIENGHYIHRDLDKIRSKVIEKQKKNKERTAAASAARWSNNASDTTSVTDMLTDVLTDKKCSRVKLKTQTLLSTFVDKNSRQKDLSTELSTIVASVGKEKTHNNLNYNDFCDCVLRFEFVLQRKMSKKEQEKISEWFAKYDMNIAIPLIEQALKECKQLPEAVWYFEYVLKNIPVKDEV